MLWVGSAGSTMDQISTVLQYKSSFMGSFSVDTIKRQYMKVISMESSPINVTLTVANKILVSKDNGFKLKPTYETDLTKYFSASIDLVSFKTPADRILVVNQVNTFVNNQTQGKIPSIISPNVLDKSTRLIIINAIYFKGVWKIKFNKLYSINGTFTRGLGFGKTGMITSTVKYMNLNNINLNYVYIDELKSHFFEVPYSGDQISMYILLPNQNQYEYSGRLGTLFGSESPQDEDINGIDRIFTNSTEFDILKMKLTNISRLKMNLTKVDHLQMPKFKFDNLTYQLKDTLMKMGMITVFDGSPSSQSDLSGINVDGKPGQLYVSNVIHKTFIEVNEEGTEAAAATVTIGKRPLVVGIPKFQRNLIMDHPFLFLIRDNRNGVTLFSGIVNQPNIVSGTK